MISTPEIQFTQTCSHTHACEQKNTYAHIDRASNYDRGIEKLPVVGEIEESVVHCQAKTCWQHVGSSLSTAFMEFNQTYTLKEQIEKICYFHESPFPNISGRKKISTFRHTFCAWTVKWQVIS